MNWRRLLSSIRLGQAGSVETDDARSAFQRDFDRIVFSSAFRRLQDKTQVFPLAQNDYVRTRLTHSLEVSCVGRTLGSKVGEVVLQRHRIGHLHPHDLGAMVAAACLAHDMGNPPFGHAGEDAIRLWFQNSSLGQSLVPALRAEQRDDFLRFEGNAQGFRLAARLQNPDNYGGLQLTCATLACASKYPRAAFLAQEAPAGIGFGKYGFFHEDRALFSEVAKSLSLKPALDGAWHRHPLAYLVEAADDICYLIIDIEDAFRLRLLSFADAQSLLYPLIDDENLSVKRRLQGIRHDKERLEFLRAKAIGSLIEQTFECFVGNEAALLSGDFNAALIDGIPAAVALAAVKNYAERNVYTSPQVVEVGAAGFEVLGGLLQAFIGAIDDVARHGARASAKSRMLMHLLPVQFVGPERQPDADLYRRLLRITDFVSGMTDTYAVNLYKKITGISLPTG